MNKTPQQIFQNWDETLIWSCLQGIMGELHTNTTQDAAMAVLGDFVFFRGKPQRRACPVHTGKLSA